MEYITVEIKMNVKKYFFKLINSIYFFFKKEIFFINCGYCEREKGKMMCYAHGGGERKQICHKCVLNM